MSLRYTLESPGQSEGKTTLPGRDLSFPVGGKVATLDVSTLLPTIPLLYNVSSTSTSAENFYISQPTAGANLINVISELENNR